MAVGTDRDKSPFETLRERHSAPAVVARATGQDPVHIDSSGGEWYHCPFHNDQGRPNLHTLPQYITCFVGGCFKGDIFDFLKAYWPVMKPGEEYNFQVASEWLESNVAEEQVQIRRTGRRHVIRAPYDFTRAMAFHHALDSKTVEYWLNRGFTWDTITRFKLGYDRDAHRYTIPNQNHVGVYGIKRRRDDAWAREEIDRRGEQWLYEQMDEIWSRRVTNAGKTGKEPLVPTEADVIKDAFPKYLWRSGDCVWLFNEARLQDSEWLPYVYLTADEASAITLEQEGYPAVCFPGDAEFPEGPVEYWFGDRFVQVTMPEVFRRALRVYVVRDRDESGHRAARRRKEILGKKAEIVQVPDGKDPNDYYRLAGSLENWMPGVPKIIDKE